MQDIILEYPLFLLIIPFYILCVLKCKVKISQIFYPNLHILKKINSNIINLIKVIQLLIIILLSVSLSSPVKENIIEKNIQNGYELSILLDASGSMSQSNKFKVVKEVVRDFIIKRKQDKLGLTIFADFAYVAIPLTFDKRSLSLLLEKLEVGIAGTKKTALYEALFMSSKLFRTSKSKNKIAILLTDGIDNTGTIPLDVAIKTAKKYNIKVYTIGIGTKNDFNEEVLKTIARETGGKFYSTVNKTELIEIYNNIDSLEKSEIEINNYVKKTYFFQQILIVVFFLYLLLFTMKEWRNNGIN